MRVQRENLSVVFGKIPPEIVAKEITQLTKTQKNIEVSHKSIPESLFINLSSQFSPEFRHIQQIVCNYFQKYC